MSMVTKAQGICGVSRLVSKFSIVYHRLLILRCDMVWTVLLLILVVFVMFEFLRSLRLPHLTTQMFGNQLTIRPTAQEESFVVDLSISYFREVVLNAKGPAWARWFRLCLYGLWYLNTVAVGTDIFFVQDFLQINNIGVKGVAFFGSVSLLFLLALFFLSGVVELGLSKSKARAVNRERVWCDEHGLDDALKQKFLSAARTVYSFDKNPLCNEPCWAFPISISGWIWVIIVVMVVATGDMFAITKGETVPIVLYADLFLWVLSSVAGLIGALYFVMRIAPWDGIAEGKTSLPFCYLWNRIKGQH